MCVWYCALPLSLSSLFCVKIACQQKLHALLYRFFLLFHFFSWRHASPALAQIFTPTPLHHMPSYSRKKQERKGHRIIKKILCLTCYLFSSAVRVTCYNKKIIKKKFQLHNSSRTKLYVSQTLMSEAKERDSSRVSHRDELNFTLFQMSPKSLFRTYYSTYST